MLSCSITSGELDSPGLFPSCSILTFPLHITIIYIQLQLDAAITTRGPKSHDDSADHLFTVPVEVLWNCVKDAENSVATSSPHDLRTLLAKTGILKTKSRAPSSLESGGAVPEAYVRDEK